MQLSAMQARLRTRFRDPNQNIVTDAEWTDYLNDAYRDVMSSSPFWPWMETVGCSAVTVPANTRSVALPTDVSRVTAVRNSTDGLPMSQIDGATNHIKAFPEQNESGVPELYRIYAGRIEVYPLPETNTVLHIEYPAPPALLANATDEPVFPEQYHSMLIEGALARAYVDDGNAAQAEIHLGQFASMLEDMRFDLLGAGRHDRYPTIVDTWWD